MKGYFSVLVGVIAGFLIMSSIDTAAFGLPDVSKLDFKGKGVVFTGSGVMPTKWNVMHLGKYVVLIVERDNFLVVTRFTKDEVIEISKAVKLATKTWQGVLDPYQIGGKCVTFIGHADSTSLTKGNVDIVSSEHEVLIKLIKMQDSCMIGINPFCMISDDMSAESVFFSPKESLRIVAAMADPNYRKAYLEKGLFCGSR